MDINRIGPGAYLPKEVPAPKAKNILDSTPKDKMEISEQAKLLQSEKVEIKNELLIKQRIKSNYYNSDEVINHIAGKILDELI